MKKAILSVLLAAFCLPLLTAQNNQVKKNPVGTWKFEAPYAPEGYTSGKIVIGLAEQKYSAAMTFTGNENKLTGEKVKVEKDTVAFSVFIESEDVKVMLKMESETKMSGKAVYSGGEVEITLTKVIIQQRK
jgi:hypothetical protein